MSTSLDPRLAVLIAAPFVRASYLLRVRSLIERYDLIAELERSSDPGRIQMKLLRDHPSALLEQASIPKPLITARRASVVAEEVNLKAAAPLPAPIERIERTTVLAFADTEWLMRELRAIRRATRLRPPDMLVDAYAERRSTDPIPDLSADMVRAIAMIPRGKLLAVCALIAGSRHGVPNVRMMLAPSRPRAQLPASRIYVCKIGELSEGQAKKVEAGNRTLAVFMCGGEVRAIDDSCPHRGGPLHLGEVEEGAVICPLHGWAFDLESGKMRGNPRIAVPTYEVERDGESIFVGPKKSGG